MSDNNFLSVLDSEYHIESACNELKKLLVSKNIKYNSSAFMPCGDFTAEQALMVRIHDKIRRFKNMEQTDDEDTLMDLAGYIILLKAVKKYMIGKK